MSESGERSRGGQDAASRVHGFFFLYPRTSRLTERAVRRTVTAEYLSLEGVTEEPGPSGAFEHHGCTVPYWNDEIAKWQTDQLFSSNALLLGRVTYEECVASWPSRSGDPFTAYLRSLRVSRVDKAHRASTTRPIASNRPTWHHCERHA
jgi:hypothetical protein